mmetsp:Transcript_20404/g.28338  ORF Transcript_20404/g.28338 Transcript_20404/m.28338 type:complete len:82 (-) Transcript_20404:46-291(-)
MDRKGSYKSVCKGRKWGKKHAAVCSESTSTMSDKRAVGGVDRSVMSFSAKACVHAASRRSTEQSFESTQSVCIEGVLSYVF